MKNKKYLLFDFDGTIADSLPIVVEITKEVSKEFGFDLTKEDIIALRNMSPLDMVKHMKFPPWKVPKLVSRIREELVKKAENIPIFPWMESLLIYLKFRKYRIGILTSNLKETVDKFLVKNKLLIFDDILTESNIFKKAKVLKKFLQEKGLNNDDVIYLGDEVRDIDFCREAKIKIIAVTWGFNEKEILKKNKPNFLADNTDDIKKILNSLK